MKMSPRSSIAKARRPDGDWPKAQWKAVESWVHKWGLARKFAQFLFTKGLPLAPMALSYVGNFKKMGQPTSIPIWWRCWVIEYIRQLYPCYFMEGGL